MGQQRRAAVPSDPFLPLRTSPFPDNPPEFHHGGAARAARTRNGPNPATRLRGFLLMSTPSGRDTRAAAGRPGAVRCCARRGAGLGSSGRPGLAAPFRASLPPGPLAREGLPQPWPNGPGSERGESRGARDAAGRRTGRAALRGAVGPGRDERAADSPLPVYGGDAGDRVVVADALGQ